MQLTKVGSIHNESAESQRASAAGQQSESETFDAIGFTDFWCFIGNRGTGYRDLGTAWLYCTSLLSSHQVHGLGFKFRLQVRRGR